MGGDGVEQTECNGEQLSFQAVGRREIVARFDGGHLSSDGGGLLLRETERLSTPSNSRTSESLAASSHVTPHAFDMSSTTTSSATRMTS